MDYHTQLSVQEVIAIIQRLKLGNLLTLYPPIFYTESQVSCALESDLSHL